MGSCCDSQLLCGCCSIAVELVQSVGRYSSLCPVIESLFHRIFLYHAPMHRLEAIKSVQPVHNSSFVFFITSILCQLFLLLCC